MEKRVTIFWIKITSCFFSFLSHLIFPFRRHFMKKLSFLLLLLMSVTALCAKIHPNGASTFPIGTEENPVTVKEYVTCLNQSEGACEDYTGWFNDADYYDHHLMDSGPNKNPVIIRSGKPQHYRYSAVPGCENKIISVLESPTAYETFKQWRRYPTLADIYNYFNDEITIQWESKSGDFNYQEFMRAYADQETIFLEKDITDSLKHLASLVLQKAPQSYDILKARYSSNGYPDGKPIVAFTISFESATEKPNMNFADNIHEYERIVSLGKGFKCIQLLFPDSLGKVKLPDKDFDQPLPLI